MISGEYIASSLLKQMDVIISQCRLRSPNLWMRAPFMFTAPRSPIINYAVSLVDFYSFGVDVVVD